MACSAVPALYWPEAVAAGTTCPDGGPDGFCDDYTGLICGNQDQSRCSDGEISIDGSDLGAIGGLGALCSNVNLDISPNNNSNCGKESGQAFTGSRYDLENSGDEFTPNRLAGSGVATPAVGGPLIDLKTTTVVRVDDVDDNANPSEGVRMM